MSERVGDGEGAACESKGAHATFGKRAIAQEAQRGCEVRYHILDCEVRYHILDCDVRYHIWTAMCATIFGLLCALPYLDCEVRRRILRMELTESTEINGDKRSQRRC